MTRSTALIYVRVSRYTAQDEGHKVSPETQVDKCSALPAVHGLRTELFQDLDYSGKNTKRPGFIALLERARRGDVAIVACYSVSRLSRSVADLYETLQQFQDLGIGFVSASEPIETTTPMGRAFLGILAVLAQLEREQTSQRVADALAFKRNQGKLLGTLPAVYRRAEDGSIVIDEAAGQIVRTIFEDYATGAYSFRTLAQRLNIGGLKPIAVRGGNGAKPAPLWSGDVLKEILARPAYAGMVEIADGLRAGEQPAIVSLELFRRCEDIRRRHRPGLGGPVRARRHRESPFALIPLLRCADCGAPMRGVAGKHRTKPYRYYVCSDRRRYGTCSAPLAHVDALEAELVTWLATCHPDDQVEAAARAVLERGLRQRRTAPSEFDERRTTKALTTRLERTTDLYRWGHIGKDDYQRERAAIEAELAQLQGQPAVPSVRQFSARITDLVAAWEDATPDQRSRLASSILSEIQVKDRTIIAVRPRPGWAPYFEELLRGVAFLERETSLELATSTLATLRSTN